MVVLEDDKNYFPPYEAVTIIRQKTLKKPLSQLSEIVTNNEMQQLNYQVKVKSRDIKEVVREFRQAKKLEKIFHSALLP